MPKTLFHTIITIVLTLGLSISAQSLLAAWVAPSADPPTQSVSYPLHTGNSVQTKQGPLEVNQAGLATDNALVSLNGHIIAANGNIQASGYMVADSGDSYIGGQLGIGVYPPTVELDVNGDIQANSLLNTSVCPDGDCDIQNNEALTAAGLGVSDIYDGSGGEVDFWDQVNMNSNRLIGLPLPTQDDHAVNKQYVDSNGGVPAGAIMAFNLASCPTGWSEIVNARGRTIVGLNTADAQFNTLGETGGEKTHVLTIAEIPSHRHNAPADTMNGGSNVDRSAFSDRGQTLTGYATWRTQATGGGGAHNNLQPYITYLYCYKE